jgi:fucose permease
VVALTGMALLLNGLVNQAITPLEHKMTLIYDVSPGKVSVSVILSFVVFFVFNFPANQIIDSRGLRLSFLIGTFLYFLGTLFYTLINKSYNFVILGTFFIGAGQPFLINSPAKIAAFWFFPKNVRIYIRSEHWQLL